MSHLEEVERHMSPIDEFGVDIYQKVKESKFISESLRNDALFVLYKIPEKEVKYLYIDDSHVGIICIDAHIFVIDGCVEIRFYHNGIKYSKIVLYIDDKYGIQFHDSLLGSLMKEYQLIREKRYD